jgi:hypothetical protein
VHFSSLECLPDPAIFPVGLYISLIIVYGSEYIKPWTRSDSRITWWTPAYFCLWPNLQHLYSTLGSLLTVK